MKRRAFVTGLGALLAAPLGAEAQQAGKIYHIGVFHVGLDHVPPSLHTLRETLRALGYDSGTLPVSLASRVMEGKNTRLDWRNLPDEAAATETAKEFVRQRVDLIVAFENQTARAAKAATTQIPILFMHVEEAVAKGLITTLARPGGNISGFIYYAVSPAKRLELFKEVVPKLRRVLVLVDPRDPVVAGHVAEVQKAAEVLKVTLVHRDVADEPDLHRVFDALKMGEVDGVISASVDLDTKFTSLLIGLAAAKRLPLATYRTERVHEGALFSYAPDVAAVGPPAAQYADRILKGVKPGDLPVARPTKFELVINLKTAKALGLTIPPSLLARADQVIE
jgi:putative tryptophan/tyrosine transport system substrate-binding protein